MASRVYVLHIADRIAAPALELLRRICQPESRSKPHITIRYESFSVVDHDAEMYLKFAPEEVRLQEPGSFDYHASSQDAISTLFIRCESEELEWLAYKPDFPDSFFHATVYDGQPSELARLTLEIMRGYPWGLSVDVSGNKIELLDPTSRSTRSVVAGLSVCAKSLLHAIARPNLDASGLLTLNADDRLKLIDRVCAYMHDQLSPDNHSSSASPNLREASRIAHFTQGELWSVHELREPQLGGRTTAELDKRLGSYLTPPEVALDVVANSEEYFSPEQPVDFGDPAIGSGIFFAAARQVFGSRLRSGIGVESDSVRAFLTARRWRRWDLRVEADDFINRALLEGAPRVNDTSDTASDLPRSVWMGELRNLIVANPPYVRSQRLDVESRQRWHDALDRRGWEVDARSDLYVYFLLAAHAWLAPDGVSAWLLPMEFMFTNYGNVVRKFLTSDVQLLKIHSYPESSRFANARVSSCVVYLKNREPSPLDRIVFSQGTSIAQPSTTQFVELSALQSAPKWHSFFRGPPRNGVGQSNTCLGDLLSVRRGIATGANKYFVLNTETVENLDIPAKWRVPVIPKPRYLKSKVISSGRDGTPAVDGLRWLINCIEPLNVIEDEAPRLAMYLLSIRDAVMERTLVRRRKPFYRQERISPPLLLYTYMAKRNSTIGRVYLNRSVGIALNNYLCLFPKPGVQRWLDRDIDRDIDLMRIVGTIHSDDLTDAGRVYVEGLTKIEPRELLKVPLHDLPKSLVESLQEDR